jgi:hypothetical protein
MRKAIAILAVIASVVASTVEAADTKRISCSLYASVSTQSLFFNSGVYTTNGPTTWMVPECADKETGFFGNLYLIAPLRDWDTGKEWDFRFGQRFRAIGLDFNASIANFSFGVGPGVRMNDTADGRLRVSRTFELTSNTSLQPYGYIDVQRSFDHHANSFAFAGGAVVNLKPNGLPGQPNLSVDIGGWKYLTTWNPNLGPVWTASASLAYDVNKDFTLGPSVMHSLGTITNSDYKKNMFSVFTVFKF